MKRILPLIFLTLFISCVQSIYAQALGDYRTAASGAWSSAATWQVFDGVNWVPAIAAPNQLAGVITVQDSVFVNGSDSADQLVVTPAGTLNILASASFKLLHSTGVDMQCAGRLIIGVGGQLVTNDTARAVLTYSSTREFDIDGAVNPIVMFTGTGLQTIHGFSGSGYIGPQITVDNAAGLMVVGVVGFSGVNFVNGKVLVPGYFILGQFSGTNFTGQSSTRYIDGNISCIVYDSTPAHFDLPIGSHNFYLPLKFFVKTAPKATETGFTVSVTDGTPFAELTLPSTLSNVSVNRFYSITNPGNTAIDTASLEISYGNIDDVSANASDAAFLRLAKSDTAAGANKWVDIGGHGSGSNEGTIASTVNFTSLGQFVLANAVGGHNALPLRITSFTASLVKQAVQLNWATANEINTNRFIVERKSSDAWETIGTMPANKLANANAYSYLDVTAKNNSTYYYRINEIDKDGTTYLSKTIQVHTGISNMNVSLLYPNPAKDVLHYFVASANNDAVTVAVTTANGKMVQQQKGMANQTLAVQVKSLPAGTYFMTFINEKTGEKVVQKFVKM